MPEITSLENGLSVVSHSMPHLETLSLGLWVGAGARHENLTEHGVSHFLEHMAFKGTKRRSARDIAEEIENVGGDLNASTSLETTAYYARVLKGDEALALDILADILQNSNFAPDEITREKEVVLQEIAGTLDSPEELAYDYLQEAAFPDQPVGRAIIGTPESVSRLGGEELSLFLDGKYVAPGMVLSAAGSVEHNVLVRHAEALFGGLNGGSVPEAEPARYVGGTKFSNKSFEQCHLLIGFKSPSYVEPDYFTAQVFSGLLGGGMSSRLFQEVREKRGLCYAIYSSAWGLWDGGLFTIHAATGRDQMDELSDVVAAELGRLAETKVSEREIVRAKAQLKSGLLMGLENSSARAEQMARHLMAYGRIMTPAELIERVEEVDGDRLMHFARNMFTCARPSISVVGAGRLSEKFAFAAEKRVMAMAGVQ
ncbi:MAG: hypothetical protein RLZ98_1353 [Pseudomonadota bacterium]